MAKRDRRHNPDAAWGKESADGDLRDWKKAQRDKDRKRKKKAKKKDRDFYSNG